MTTLALLPWPRDGRYLVREDGVIIGPRGRPVGSPTAPGYVMVSVRFPDGSRTSTTAGVMVCETFHGPRPEGHQAAHEDGDPSNNAAGNLSWKLPVANAADRVRHGTNGRKLTVDQVQAIRAVGPRVPSPRVAEEYGVAESMIRHVRNGHSWAGLAVV